MSGPRGMTITLGLIYAIAIVDLPEPWRVLCGLLYMAIAFQNGRTYQLQQDAPPPPGTRNGGAE